MFVALEKLINLHDGYTRHCRIEFYNLLLLQRGDRCYVIESSCPHQQHSLEHASITDGVLQCPLHNYQFSLVSGELLYSSDEPCRSLRLWPVVYEGNEIGVSWVE